MALPVGNPEAIGPGIVYVDQFELRTGTSLGDIFEASMLKKDTNMLPPLPAGDLRDPGLGMVVHRGEGPSPADSDIEPSGAARADRRARRVAGGRGSAKSSNLKIMRKLV